MLFKRLSGLVALSIICGFITYQAMAAQTFSTIQVEGNERVEANTIIAHLKLSPGSSYSDEDLNLALRRLFATNFFSDASLKVVGSTLMVKVTENPLVNQVAFEGNKEIEDKILSKEMQLRPRQVYTLSRLKHDTKRIQDLYRLKGYFAATVTPNIIKRDQNRVDVVFEIKEGSSTTVEKISFVGNYAFDESKLEEVIRTKESRWYRFFTSDDNYDPARLAYDQDQLRQFYLRHGYVDFQIKSAVAELSPDQKEFFITFTLEEGERYKYGDVKVTSDYPKIDPKSLEKHVLARKGKWYNQKEIEDTITALTDALGDQGFAFVDVYPQINKNAEKLFVDLTFEIKEGPHVFIDQIIIKGNQRTNSDVIRREMRLHEGDAYNTSKVRESERRIKNLGFFKDVKISKEASNAPDKVNLIVEVEEEPSTGSLQLSGGFSTSDGPLAGVKVEERNLGGRGQYISLSGQIALRSQDYQFSFTEPHFLNRELSAGVDLFRTLSSPRGTAFDEKSLGGTLRFGYELRKDLYQKLAYTLRQDEVSSISEDASRFIREEKRKVIKSILSQTLLYDKTDSQVNPTDGYDIELSNSFAGLGGSVRYLKNILTGRYFYPVYENWTLVLTGSGGALFGLGDRVRIADRFSLGGYSLRGFDFHGVGPRAKEGGDSLGGLYYWRASAEVLFPIGLPKEFGVKGLAFLDIGNLFGHKFPSSEVIDSRRIRIGSGFGISWTTPLGPVGLDVGFPLVKSTKDRTRVILLRFGPRF